MRQKSWGARLSAIETNVTNWIQLNRATSPVIGKCDLLLVSGPGQELTVERVVAGLASSSNKQHGAALEPNFLIMVAFPPSHGERRWTGLGILTNPG